MNLLLLETSGNQHYIFSTNKLRENVGASELTYQIGTRIVVEQVRKDYKYSQDKDGSSLRKLLLNEKPVDSTGKDAVEIIIATSGKAMLLTNTKDKAKEIVRNVTQTALETMPGLTVHGAIVAVKDDLTDIHDAVKKVHHKLEEIRDQLPGNAQRFQRLPFVEPCATSGFPANKIYQHESLKGKKEELKPYSILSIEKQEASNKGKDRLENTIKSAGLSNFKLPTNINELEKTFPKTDWLAVVHADGNGLGEIFLKFDKYLNYPNEIFDGRTYINEYRKFSIALDECTIKATVHGLKNLQIEVTKPGSKHSSNGEIPVIPLILGGDDLTVICDGEYAIKFTCDFLTEFENQTSQNDLIRSIAEKAFGVSRLGICAGIAIIKPHYPFHQAYDLAENLIKSAKQVKTKVLQTDGRSLPCSAMDFHVLYDSSGVELNRIREKLEVAEKDGSKTYLYAKPYILTDKTELEKAVENDWLENRTWDKLETRVCAMSATEKDDDGKHKLPNSQLHHIRESLFRGQKETDSEMKLFKHRYSDDNPEKDKGFGKLLCGDSLFFKEKHKETDAEGHTTHFLDALDVVELWKGFSKERCEKILKKESDETEAQNEQ